MGIAYHDSNGTACSHPYGIAYLKNEQLLKPCSKHVLRFNKNAPVLQNPLAARLMKEQVRPYYQRGELWYMTEWLDVSLAYRKQ